MFIFITNIVLGLLIIYSVESRYIAGTPEPVRPQQYGLPLQPTVSLDPKFAPRKLGIVREDNKPKPSYYQTPPKESERYIEQENIYDNYLGMFYYQPNAYAVQPVYQTPPYGYGYPTPPTLYTTTASTTTTTTPTTTTTTTTPSTTTTQPSTYPPDNYAPISMPYAPYSHPMLSAYGYLPKPAYGAPYNMDDLPDYRPQAYRRRPYRRPTKEVTEYEEPDPFSYKAPERQTYGSKYGSGYEVPQIMANPYYSVPAPVAPVPQTVQYVQTNSYNPAPAPVPVQPQYPVYSVPMTYGMPQ